MKPRPRVPFFETGVKNYIYGDAVVDFARAADASAARHDVDVIFIAPYTEIRTISQLCPNLIVIAQYMDTIRPGRGMGAVLPEALKSGGAQGVVINHCERPMTLPQILQTIQRADELGMLTFVCADTVKEAKVLAQLCPDILNPEPSELIGSGAASPLGYVREVAETIKATNPNILVEQAAGITTAQQVYDFIMAGSDGAGAASGILQAPQPLELLDEMVAATARARAALHTNDRA